MRKFKDNRDEQERIVGYFNKVTRNGLENMRKAMTIMKMLKVVERARVLENVKGRLRGFIVRALRGRLMAVIQAMRSDWELGKHTKKESAYKINKTVMLALQKYVLYLTQVNKQNAGGRALTQTSNSSDQNLPWFPNHKRDSQ